MQLMRDRDPQDQEDGFHLLLPHAAEHIDQLIAEFAKERIDHGLRCWLLELIGQARSPKALSVLTEQTPQRRQVAAVLGGERSGATRYQTSAIRAVAAGTSHKWVL
jgi:hypothetical protein